MRIFYNDIDISQYVLVRRCVNRDCAGGRCDSLELEMERADIWDRWRPEIDDRIHVQHGTYDTGQLYVSAVSMDESKYRIYAASLPSRAFRKQFYTYKDMQISDIMSNCAARSGLDWAVYGVDDAAIPYATQNLEGFPAFLQRILVFEGGTLKAVNGRLSAIGIRYAQRRSPVLTIPVLPSDRHVQYTRTDRRYSTLQVVAPGIEVTARDTAAAGGLTERLYLPVSNVLQAGRWARGLLLHKNRTAETLTMDIQFNSAVEAMARIDVVGGTQADGEWLVEEVTHDIYNGRTSVTMHRCLDTVE